MSTTHRTASSHRTARARVSRSAASVAALLVLASSANAYNPVPTDGRLKAGPGRLIDPSAGPGFPRLPADRAWGKEYVNDTNLNGTTLTAVADPEQVNLWDGQGGFTDGYDFTGVRSPTDLALGQVDAIANSRDTLFRDLIGDKTTMVFSYNNEVYGEAFPGFSTQLLLPSAAAVSVAAGTLGGAGELTYSLNNTGAMGVWATRPEVDFRGATPTDIAGVELWGPEFTDVEPFLYGDTDKFSLSNDELYDAAIYSGNGKGYVSGSAITAAVESLLGPVPNDAFLAFGQGQGREAIDVDALMVWDSHGDPLEFDACGACDFPSGFDQEGRPVATVEAGDFGDALGGPAHDTILFSIRQMPRQGGGYYATGSELFVLDASGAVSFLQHGGNTWDKDFAETHLRIEDQFFPETDFVVHDAVIDLNAIEAIGDLVSEPGDLDADGDVDDDDFGVFAGAFGGFGPTGDFDGDGDVDDDDFGVFAGGFGVGVGPQLGTSVPEPTGAALAATVLLVGVVRRRA